MASTHYRLVKRFLAASLTIIVCAYTAGTKAEDLQFSGFARVVVGYLDEKNAEYLGYDKSVDVGQQTLLGLQADYKLTDSLSVSGQVLAHSSNERDSRIEWLYLNYSPHKAWQFKIGKQRTPFFNYSDIIDVGFAYPWINPPQQVYSSYFFSNFDGVLGSYEYVGKQFALNLEAYWGSFDDEFYVANNPIQAKVDDFRGLISNLTYNNWSFRASYHIGDAEVDLPELTGFSSQLRQFGFVQSADSLRVDGEGEFFQLSANYENLDYFVRSELTQIKSEVLIVPEIRGYYISAGYNFYPFTAYVTFADSDASYDPPENDIPVGLSPQLDQLAFGYQAIFAALPQDTLRSWSIGTRWDWKTNLAFKAEMTFLDGEDNQRAFFNIINPQAFDGKATLYQVALEWVF